MTLGEKVRTLRQVEGDLRQLGREMTQQEVATAIQKELGASFSQSYLSQVESGARPHLTQRTRLLLARFFKVHPGFLVSDPPGFHRHLTSELRDPEVALDEWVLQGADRFSSDAELHDALQRIAGHADTRQCLTLLGAIVDTPHLVERLLDALTPAAPKPAAPPPESGSAWMQ